MTNNVNINNFRFAHVQNTLEGTYTIAYKLGDKGAFYSIARCNPKDNFCRKTGRTIAGHRLAKGIDRQYVTFDEVGTDRYGAIVQHIVHKMSETLPPEGLSYAETQAWLAKS
jgi:hypothetical protein